MSVYVVVTRVRCNIAHVSVLHIACAFYMYICVYIYIISTYTHIYIYTFERMQMSIYACIYIYNIDIYIHLDICPYEYTYINTRVICVYIFLTKLF